MAWNDRAITMQGLEMLRRCLGGEKLILDWAAGGAGTAPAASLMSQTSLADQRQTFAFGGPPTDVEGGKRVNILITSAGLEQGYTLRQVGVWAHIEGEGPALFALLQDDGDGTPVYSQAEFGDFAMNFYMVLAIHSGAELAVTIDPAAMASMAALQAAVAALAPIEGEGPPKATDKGNPGQHYLDRLGEKEYVCLSAAPGEYRWKLVGADQADEIDYGEITVEAALDALDQDQARQDAAIQQAQQQLADARQALAAAAARLDQAEQAIAQHAGTLTGHAGNSAIHVTQAEKDGWNAKVPPTRKVNDKALSGDITLAAADVGAASKERGVYYGTCATAAGTAAKVATVLELPKLVDGVVVVIKFESANTVESPTLNVNGTGARNLYYSKHNAGSYISCSPIKSGHWSAGSVKAFLCHGNDWIMLDGDLASVSTYGLAKLSDSINSTSTLLAATPNAVKKAYEKVSYDQGVYTQYTKQSVLNYGVATLSNFYAYADSIYLIIASANNGFGGGISVHKPKTDGSVTVRVPIYTMITVDFYAPDYNFTILRIKK